MEERVLKFSDYRKIAQNLLNRFSEIIEQNGSVSVAVSGGSTPLKIFEYWRDAKYTDWHRVKIFWVDERVVPVDSDENNYGNALRIFRENPAFPLDILVPMKTDGPDLAGAYESVLEQNTSYLDIVLLGIGDDGHTASIFPGQYDLFDLSERVALSVNPYSGQQRITLTGKELFKSPEVYFIALGEAKQPIIDAVINVDNKEKFPASFVFLSHKNAKIITDIQL